MSAVDVRQSFQRDVKRQVGEDIEVKFSNGKLFESEAALFELEESIKRALTELLETNMT